MPVNNAENSSNVRNLFPWASWSMVSSIVNKEWDPVNNPHHVVIGATGSGKSYLVCEGILKPMCSRDRVLIVDTKGDDPLVSTLGKPCRELPNKTWYRGITRREEPYDNWHRIVAYDETAKAKVQIWEALRRVIREGNWVVYLDEAVEVVDPKPPNLGLHAIVSHGLRKGRSRRVPFISATQAPVFIPRWVVDQSSFAWIGYIRDEDRQKRLVQIGGLAKQDLPYLSSLKKRDWMLCADSIDSFYRTKVELGGEK